MWLGLVIGIVSGGAQLALLSRFTRALTGGDLGVKTVGAGILQLFLPFAVLVACAFLIPKSLLWAGVGIAASLVLGGIILFIHMKKGSNNG
ncbi:MAG: hypothetical protein LBT12_05880 [Oscillospiraceae bacterium]|jgi:hypothetical protein|nr:hypothetical protein [Oscillospiraceae bacterium]